MKSLPEPLKVTSATRRGKNLIEVYINFTEEKQVAVEKEFAFLEMINEVVLYCIVLYCMYCKSIPNYVIAELALHTTWL